MKCFRFLLITVSLILVESCQSPLQNPSHQVQEPENNQQALRQLNTAPFDWTVPALVRLYPTNAQEVDVYPPLSNTNEDQSDSYVKSRLGNKESADFTPAQGWIYLGRNFGVKTDTTYTPTPYPYFLIYNKYKGVLRLFAYNPASINSGGSNSTNLEVSLRVNKTNSFFNSKIINHDFKYKNSLQDSESYVINNIVQNTTGWFYSDFNLALYDAAYFASKQETQLDINIMQATISNIKLSGTLLQNGYPSANGDGLTVGTVGNSITGHGTNLFNNSNSAFSNAATTYKNTASTVSAIQTNLNDFANNTKLPDYPCLPKMQNAVKSLLNKTEDLFSFANNFLPGITSVISFVTSFIGGGSSSQAVQFSAGIALSGTISTNQLSSGITLGLPSSTRAGALAYKDPLGVYSVEKPTLLRRRYISADQLVPGYRGSSIFPQNPQYTYYGLLKDPVVVHINPVVLNDAAYTLQTKAIYAFDPDGIFPPTYDPVKIGSDGNPMDITLDLADFNKRFLENPNKFPENNLIPYIPLGDPAKSIPNLKVSVILKPQQADKTPYLLMNTYGFNIVSDEKPLGVWGYAPYMNGVPTSYKDQDSDTEHLKLKLDKHYFYPDSYYINCETYCYIVNTGEGRLTIDSIQNNVPDLKINVSNDTQLLKIKFGINYVGNKIELPTRTTVIMNTNDSVFPTKKIEIEFID